MAWLLLVALIFVVIILGIIIGATKLFEYVNKNVTVYLSNVMN